ncbi:MAG: lipopolysaccharide biosynthesis protein RfbH [Negativicutes bacterium]|nr:lipopolysaccharide biosynthesis protein RfbH [Negativicutes bacterium]
MTSEYTGTIFKIIFPFTDLSGNKARPALALSEPDQRGDMTFAFITTKQSHAGGAVIDVPDGLLPFASHLHLDKIFLLNRSLMQKPIAQAPPDFLEKVLKELTLLDVARYYRQVHAPRASRPFVPGQTRVNYAGRVFDDTELRHLVDASLEFWLTYGRFSRQFEQKLSEYLGIPYVFLVNSGSSANLLAFMALTSPLLKERAIQRGNEIITVAACFPTTVAPIVQYGAVPVFVDMDLASCNVDVSQLDAALSSKTKAVMLAHTLGNPFDIQAVKAFCDNHGLWLIEDNCDALGSRYLGQYTGTWGHIGTSSFYPPHHMTMGEGGAIYTADKVLRKIILSMRDWGRDCWCESGVDNTCGCRFSKQYGSLPFGYDHKYVYSHFGYNLKPTDLQAAIGCAQLEKLEMFSAKRRENFRLVRDGLEDLRHIFHLPQATSGSDPSWFGFFLTLRDGVAFTRNQLVRHLEAANIQTRNLFAGNITRHPCFTGLVSGRDYKIIGELSVTDKIMNDGFWIGVYPGMGQEVVQYMLDTFRSFVRPEK